MIQPAPREPHRPDKAHPTGTKPNFIPQGTCWKVISALGCRPNVSGGSSTGSPLVYSFKPSSDPSAGA